MSNTCCNSIRIDGTHHAVKSILSALRNTPDSAWHSKTMLDMLKALGCSDKALKGVDLREEITSFKLEDGKLLIESESSSNFKTEAWEIVKRRFPSVSVLYRAEEFGCDIFQTNDLNRVYFKDVYALDWYDQKTGAGEIEYFPDEESLVKYVADNIDPSTKDFLHAQFVFDGLNLRDEDSFAVLHEISYDDYSNLS